MIFGAHPINMSILEGVKYIKKLGGNAIQVFLKSPIKSTAKMIETKKEIKEIKSLLKKENIYFVVHSSYMLNYCHPISGRKMWALYNLISDMNSMIKLTDQKTIGAVLHFGSQKDYTKKEAWKNTAKSLEFVLERTPKQTHIYLETPAKKEICNNLKDLAKFYNGLTKEIKERVKICVDTAHVFQAGEPINTQKGMRDYLERFDKSIGINNIKLIHLNDAFYDQGALKDKHMALGEGYVFDSKQGGSLDALKELLSWTQKYNIPVVLETKNDFKNDFKIVKKLASELAHTQLKKPVPQFRRVERLGLVESGLMVKQNKIKSDVAKRLNTNKGRISLKTKKKRVIDIFKQMAKIYYFHGDNIRNKAYNYAIFALKVHDLDHILTNQVYGIGKKSIMKIEEIIKTGSLKKLKELKKDPNIKSHYILNKILGVGPATAKKWMKVYKIQTIKDLKTEVKSENIKLTKIQKIGLKYYKDINSYILYKEGIIWERELKKRLKGYKIDICGSYRRGADKLHDIDILITHKSWNTTEDIIKSKALSDVMKRLSNIYIDTISYSKGQKIQALFKLGNTVRQLDIVFVPYNSYHTGLLYSTGGQALTIYMRDKAKKMGYLLNRYGLYKGKKRIKILSEKDVFEILDIPFIEPNLR
jgi:apurinic endonuclease APN1